MFRRRGTRGLRRRRRSRRPPRPPRSRVRALVESCDRKCRLGGGDQTEPSRRDYPERSLGAHHEACQVIAGSVLTHGSAERDELARGHDCLDAEHPVAGDAVLERVRPARVRGDVAADVRLLGGSGVGRERRGRSRAPGVGPSRSAPRLPRACAMRAARRSGPAAGVPSRERRLLRRGRRRPRIRCRRRAGRSGRRARSTTPTARRCPRRFPARPPRRHAANPAGLGRIDQVARRHVWKDLSAPRSAARAERAALPVTPRRVPRGCERPSPRRSPRRAPRPEGRRRALAAPREDSGSLAGRHPTRGCSAPGPRR